LRLALVTPAWRRFDVTRVALAQRAHLSGVLAGQGIEVSVLVVADDENLDVAAEFGFNMLERPNDRLGCKWNDGIEHACTVLEADLVTVVGSDDWIHPDLFDLLPSEVAPPPQLTAERPFVMWSDDVPEAVTGREIALVDLASGRLRRCRGKGPYGVIPWVLPTAALAPSRFRPVRDDLQRGLDGSLVAGLGVRPEWVFHDPHDLCRVDFKSDTNLNTYEAITGAIGYGEEETDPWGLLATRYPADLVDQARELSERMQQVAA
jgi:hypothetical protein